MYHAIRGPLRSARKEFSFYRFYKNTWPGKPIAKPPDASEGAHEVGGRGSEPQGAPTADITCGPYVPGALRASQTRGREGRCTAKRPLCCRDSVTLRGDVSALFFLDLSRRSSGSAGLELAFLFVSVEFRSWAVGLCRESPFHLAARSIAGGPPSPVPPQRGGVDYCLVWFGS